MRLVRSGLLLAIAVLVVGCESARPAPEVERDRLLREMRQDGSILGDSLSIGGDGAAAAAGGIAVNGYLWRASLDTISFFPMAQVDAHGGVIITEWYALPEAPAERYKMTVYILNRELRADGVRVSLFKQVQSGSAWVDAPVAEGSAAKIENAILTRARQMRINNQASVE